MNLKILTTACIAKFSSESSALYFLWFPMFVRVFPTGRNGGSGESPVGSPSISRNFVHPRSRLHQQNFNPATK